MPQMREAATPLPESPLVARLVEEAPPPAPAAEPPASPPQEEKREEKAKPPALKKPVRKPRPKAVPRAAAPIAPPAPPAEQPAPEPAPRAEAVEPQAPAPAPPPPVASITPSAPAAAPDPTAALARFRQQLVELAVRYKRYPTVARDNGWTGDVVVRVETSSGYDVLDEQALEMFRRAAPAVRVPPALQGKDFSVEVRAVYNLQDRPG
jgi:protein TonB